MEWTVQCQRQVECYVIRTWDARADGKVAYRDFTWVAWSAQTENRWGEHSYRVVARVVAHCRCCMVCPIYEVRANHKVLRIVLLAAAVGYTIWLFVQNEVVPL